MKVIESILRVLNSTNFINHSRSYKNYVAVIYLLNKLHINAKIDMNLVDYETFSEKILREEARRARRKNDQ